MGSSNGTYINYQRIRSSYLAINNILSFGKDGPMLKVIELDVPPGSSIQAKIAVKEGSSFYGEQDQNQIIFSRQTILLAGIIIAIIIFSLLSTLILVLLTD